MIRRRPPDSMRRPVTFRPSPSPGGESQTIIDNLSAIQHEFYALHLGNILQRISGNRDDVGELAWRRSAGTLGVSVSFPYACPA